MDLQAYEIINIWFIIVREIFLLISDTNLHRIIFVYNYAKN